MDREGEQTDQDKDKRTRQNAPAIGIRRRHGVTLPAQREVGADMLLEWLSPCIERERRLVHAIEICSLNAPGQ